MKEAFRIDPQIAATLIAGLATTTDSISLFLGIVSGGEGGGGGEVEEQGGYNDTSSLELYLNI